MDEQTETKSCLQVLCGMESGLTPGEVEWVERFSQVKDRPFRSREREIILGIYDRACELELI